LLPAARHIPLVILKPRSLRAEESPQFSILPGSPFGKWRGRLARRRWAKTR
jgi:hypothetical protein